MFHFDYVSFFLCFAFHSPTLLFFFTTLRSSFVIIEAQSFHVRYFYHIQWKMSECYILQFDIKIWFSKNFNSFTFLIEKKSRENSSGAMIPSEFPYQENINGQNIENIDLIIYIRARNYCERVKVTFFFARI